MQGGYTGTRGLKRDDSVTAGRCGQREQPVRRPNVDKGGPRGLVAERANDRINHRGLPRRLGGRRRRYRGLPHAPSRDRRTHIFPPLGVSLTRQVDHQCERRLKINADGEKR